MTLALGLLATSVLIGLFGPWYLRKTITPHVQPGLALTGWIVSVLLVVGSAVAGALLLSIPNNAAADGLIGMTAVCVNTGQYLWETVLRLAGMTVVLTAAIRTLSVAIGMCRRDTARRHEHLSTLRFVGRTEPGDPRLLWLTATTPVAYSVGGREAAIVASTGICDLEPPARAAVLAHERAHLRGRHHGLVLLVDVLRRALPFVPLFQAAPAAVHVLVELAADATAARSCGERAVRTALRAVGAESTPSEALAMSREAVELRLRWLTPVAALSGVGARLRARYTVATLAALSPAAAGIGGTAALVTVLCLTIGSPPV